MAEDRQGNLWVGTWSGGLLHRDPTGRWQQFSRGTGLAENDVAAVFVDRENNIWVGTGSGGVHRFKPRIFRTYDQRDGLVGNTVMSVAGSPLIRGRTAWPGTKSALWHKTAAARSTLARAGVG
jgi:ligand-binding sensor domain-containing protein